MIELNPKQIPDDLKKYFRPKRKYGSWILRNCLIWHKPNPMPSSAKDRFTVDFEYVYFFVKQKRYWFESQYEPYLTESNAERPRMGQGQNTQYNQKRKDKFRNSGRYVNQTKYQDNSNYGGGGFSFQGHSGTLKANGTQIQSNPLGRNKRTVWTIPTQPFPEAHFATFPEKLVEPMIKAGCPEFVCIKCGKAREKIMEPSEEYKKHLGTWTPDQDKSKAIRARLGFTVTAAKDKSLTADYRFKGYTDCGCNAGWRPGAVLDPFVVRAQPAWLLPRTDGIGLGLNLNRSISSWRCAA